MNNHQKLKFLQEKMRKEAVQAYLILHCDPHMSEYLSAYWKVREFISGFTGSAGHLLILQDKAYLYTDGRYFIQAQKELFASGIELCTSKETFLDYIKTQLFNAKLALNFKNLSLSLYKELDLIAKENKLTLLHQEIWINELWQDRTPLFHTKIYEHEAKFCGLNRKEKINVLRKELKKLKADGTFISSLDDIAWIMNLRGSDVEFNPVFLSFLFITQKRVILFAFLCDLSTTLKQKLKNEGFELKNYDESSQFLSSLKCKNLLIDPNKTNFYLIKLLDKNIKLIEKTNPSTFLKACKSPKELSCIKKAMVEDGIALCEFFAYLDEKLKQKKPISELDIDEKITEFRAKSKFYVSNSFATIAGFNANGAIIHYRASEESFAMIQGKGLLLIDSGAQYKLGTTDITRVVPVAKVSLEQKRAYTLVLKAHIALASAIFPKGIALSLLDVIARRILWENALDYPHGTGHGVGYFLNVHEGPAVLSYTSKNFTKVQEAMISSIEPGLYFKDKWGIRLENLVVCVKKIQGEFGEFLGFETLSLCPFEPSLIDLSLLDAKEKKWLNAYHKKVYEKLAKHLKGKALRWLTLKTKEL